MHDPVELLVPKTTGALLAEEWSIDPYSPLPSFLEMTFMQDATRSCREAFKTAYDWMLQKLSSAVVGRENRCKRCAVALVTVLKLYSVEWRYLLLYFLERHCLRVSSATLAERMYGSKRALVMNEAGHRDRKRVVALDRKHATRLALLLVLGPYMNETMELFLQNHQSVFGRSLRPTRRRILEIILRLLRAGTQAGNLYCQWRFLLGKSPHFDLVSVCLRMVVRRQTQQDQMQQQQSKSSSKDSPRMPSPIRTAVVTVTSLALAVSWLTQMRVTWLEHEASRRLQSADSETNLPPPPHRKAVVLSRSCPKCHGAWIEPAVAVPGDFRVYCRECLDPDATQKVVRLYEPQATSPKETNE